MKKKQEWFTEPNRLWNWLKGHKHSWRDIGVGLTSAYICQECHLQKTMIGYKTWWYRYAPWLANFDPNEPSKI